MDNYLTTLYYTKFKINEREAELMNNNTWTADEQGMIANVRNDQSISEVRLQHKIIDNLIEKYLEHIKH